MLVTQESSRLACYCALLEMHAVYKNPGGYDLVPVVVIPWSLQAFARVSIASICMAYADIV